MKAGAGWWKSKTAMAASLVSVPSSLLPSNAFDSTKVDRLEEALRYIELGWFVLPLWWPIGLDRCACPDPNCRSIGKHPIGSLAPRGEKDATRAPAVIRKWWLHHPDANIGGCPGRSGFIAIDIDPRNGGESSWMKLEAEHGVAPETVTSQTGDGRHLLFAHPGGLLGSGKGLGVGIDIRGDTGYIVLPPSLHKSGKSYRWIRSPLLDSNGRRNIAFSFSKILIQGLSGSSPAQGFSRP